MTWLCLRCRATYAARPEGACAMCFQWDALVQQPETVRGRPVEIGPRKRAGALRAADLRPDGRRAWYGEPWRSAWRLGLGHALALVGPPGGGKSTLASQLAVSAARQVEVLYAAIEEGHSPALAARLVRAGLDDLTGHRLVVSDARDLMELGDDLDAHPAAQLVVIDSLTELGASPATLTGELLGRTAWIATAHVNTRSTTRGGPELDHAADAVIWVEDGQARPLKNRWGGMDEVRVFEQEVRNAK